MFFLKLKKKIKIFLLVIVLMGVFLPLSSKAYTFNNYLDLGDSGPDVSALQRLLKDLGFFKHPEVTGFFGSITQSAIQSFQISKNIVSSGSPNTNGFGRVGPNTLKALNDFSVNPTPSSSNVSKSTSSSMAIKEDLSLGSSGEEVKIFQIYLSNLGFYKYPIFTGYFGEITKSAVVSFQAANGILPTGKIDLQTRLKISELALVGSNHSHSLELSTPITLTADSSKSNQIILSWEANSTTSVYSVKRKDVDSGNYVIIAENISGNMYIDENIIAGKPYMYFVVSIKEGVEKDASNIVTTLSVRKGGGGGNSGGGSRNNSTSTPVDTTAPAIPTNLNLDAGDAAIDITWTDPVDLDFNYISIYRGTISGTLSLIATTTSGVEEFTDIPLSNGATYYYALTATDDNENESLLSDEENATPIGVFDIYVDSVGGNDSNDGTSDYEAFQTLAVARTAALAEGNGVSIGLKSGSLWRESLNLSSLTNVTVESYSTGTPPIVTGFDIKTSWTQDLTNTNLWYVDITHDTNGTNRPVVIDNGEFMYRRTTIGSANSNDGSYYSADSGTANPLRVYINPVGNPNTDGHVYEVTTRSNAIFLGDGADLEGVVARGAMSNNGPIEVGINSTLRRCVAAYGTKHNILLESGTIEDCVMYESDAPSQSEPGQTMLVAFTPNATGLSVNLNRLLAYTERQITSVVYAHTLNDPADAYESITCNSCVGYLVGPGGGGIAGGPGEYAVLNSAIYGQTAGAISINFSASTTISHFIGQQTSDIPNQGGTNANWNQVAFVRNGTSGGSQSPIKIIQGSTVNIKNTTISTPTDFFGNGIGWVNDTTGTLSLNRSLISANNALTIPTTATYTASNNNVYVRSNIGPFATYNGTGYNLTTQMAGYRTATGQEANSVASTTSLFTGSPSNGDFRINTAGIVTAGHDGNAGVTEHWDYNQRQIVAGSPSAWPTVPTTFEEALEYIEDPEEWDFYP